MALVLAQDAVNKAFPPIPDKLSTIGESVSPRMSRVVSRLTAHWHKGTPAPAATPGIDVVTQRLAGPDGVLSDDCNNAIRRWYGSVTA